MLNNSPYKTLFGIDYQTPRSSFSFDSGMHHHHGLPSMNHGMHRDSSYWTNNSILYDHNTSPHDSIYSLDNFQRFDGGLQAPAQSESDGSDNAVIDFDLLWQWPPANANLGPTHASLGTGNPAPGVSNAGPSITKAGPGATNVGLGIGNTGMDMMGEGIAPDMHDHGELNLHDPIDRFGLDEFDDGLLPLFGLPHSNYGLL